MKKVGIVSCDKWKGKIEEDQNLRDTLREMGVEADIISWQKPIMEADLLVIRSIWGYQNHYQEFISWLKAKYLEKAEQQMFEEEANEEELDEWYEVDA